MLFVLLAVVGGLVAGWLAGGSLKRLEATRLRQVRVVVLALVVQLVAAFLLTGWSYAAALVVSLLVAVGWLALNPSLSGRGLIAAGLLANGLVIVANGAMPVSLAAAGTAGVQTGPLLDDARHELAGPDTHLALLDDRIPLALPWQPQVLSAGDVLVAAGVALMITQAMRRRISPDATAVPPGRAVPPEVLLVPPPGRAEAARAARANPQPSSD